jgi:transcriptional regulator with XRE-family HTH domain
MRVFDPKLLRSALDDAGLVPAAAAARANISHSSLSRYLSGEIVPSANALGALAEVTAKSTDSFFSPACACMHKDDPDAVA